MKCLYLVALPRLRPSYYHPTTPYHPVVVCMRAKVASLRAGDSTAGAMCWQYFYPDLNGSGWLLVRWRGLDIDYGHLVRGFDLPDGSQSGFCHPGTEPWKLLKGALWWSTGPMPRGVAAAGVLHRTEVEGSSRTKGDIESDETDAADPTEGVRSLGYRVKVLDLAASDLAAHGRCEMSMLPFGESEAPR